jgi:hypothetical protein
VLLGHVESLDAHAIVREHLDDGAARPLSRPAISTTSVAFANLFHLRFPRPN